jgi:4-hydroxybenzoate polyprenyltransferase
MQSKSQSLPINSYDFSLNNLSALTINLFRSLRPAQWSKNLLLFAGLIFSHNLFSMANTLKVVLGFTIFCFLSGCIYIINDLVDLDKDRYHPVKRYRPLAAGKVTPSLALQFATSVFVISSISAYFLDSFFALICLVYVTLMVSYSLLLKNIVILDVIIIAMGFVLRAVAGAVLIDVEISPWLLVCTLFLALFLAVAKRRHELTLLAHNAANHRDSLSAYSTTLLDQMIAVVTTSTLIAYTLYTLAPRTREIVGTPNLAITLPFVIYGIFRYLYLIYQKNEGGSPEILIFSDKSLMIDLILWVIVVIMVLYFK